MVLCMLFTLHGGKMETLFMLILSRSELISVWAFNAFRIPNW